MVLNDSQIRKLCTLDQYQTRYRLTTENAHHTYDRPMIQPFDGGESKTGKISYGLTSAGYDLRLDTKKLLKYKRLIFGYVDPKMFNDVDYKANILTEVTPTKDNVFELEPYTYYLGMSYEYLNVPPILKGICVGKSTYARCGILINTTPLEPGWEGHLTIEIANLNSTTVKVYGGEGIAQLEFHTLHKYPDTCYKTKNGIYQGQQDITPSRVRE